jgi:hypothetical protein
MVVPRRCTTYPTDGEPEHNRRTSAQQPTRYDDGDDDDNTEAQQVLVFLPSLQSQQETTLQN